MTVDLSGFSLYHVYFFCNFPHFLCVHSQLSGSLLRDGWNVFDMEAEMQRMNVSYRFMLSCFYPFCFSVLSDPV